MISSLVSRLDFAPVPRVEIRLDELTVFDGGSAASTGSTVLDGGSAASTGTAADGGGASLNAVTIPPNTDQVTVWRIVDGVSYKVQGVVERSYQGTFGVLDHGAPPNAVSSYELECFASGQQVGRVSLGSTFSGSELGPSEVIVQNPLNPNLYAVVRNMAGSWPEMPREFPGDGVDIEGENLPTFVGFGPMRTGPIQVDFEAKDRETARRLLATLGTKEKPQIPVWLIRSPNPGLLPPVFYGRVVGLREVDVTVGRSKGQGGGGKSRFRATLQQVKQPAPALAAPTLTYSDLAAALGGTYSGIAAALPRYSDWATAWEYSGAAG